MADFGASGKPAGGSSGALRGGITIVLIPAENEKDLAEIPQAVKDSLEIHPVAHVDEVLALALSTPLQPIEWTDADEHAAEPVVSPAGSAESPSVRH